MKAREALFSRGEPQQVKEYLMKSSRFGWSENAVVLRGRTRNGIREYTAKDLREEELLIRLHKNQDAAQKEWDLFSLHHRSGLCFRPVHLDIRLQQDLDGYPLVLQSQEFRLLDPMREIQRTARLFAAMHQLPKQGFGEALEEKPLQDIRKRAGNRIQRIMPSGLFTAKHMDFFEHFLTWADRHRSREDVLMASDTAAVIGDVEFANIALGKDLFFLDWQEARKGYAWIEIAQFLSPVNLLWQRGKRLPRAEREAFLLLYDDVETEKRMKHFMPWLLLDQMSSLAEEFFLHSRAGAPPVPEAYYQKLKFFVGVDLMMNLLREWI